MPARPSAVRLLFVALTSAALAAALPGRVRAEGDDTPKDLDELVARLRNPFFAKQAERDLQIVQLMLRQRSAKADGYLRELLGDTGAHPVVVEQIVIATLLDEEHRLLEPVVERLRVEAGSQLDRSLDLALVTYSDAGFVQRLAEFARDASRPTAQRVVAVELLGRTGRPEALDPLLDLWSGPQRELREPAARGFDRILPVGVTSHADAVALREDIRGIPFTEAMRRLLRRGNVRAVPAAASRDAEPDYVRLATRMLPRATLEQVLESYLGSSVPAVRAMGARRVAEFPFDAADAPDGKLRAARECLAALRREDVEAVEIELLAALSARAAELRGAVGEDDLAALTARVGVAGRASNAVRLASVRLVGELRDPRAIGVMESTFAALKDGDVELRLALLDALQQMPGDLTPWLIERLAVESHTRVVRKLVVLLNRAEDPAAITAFGRLLASHPDQQVRWDVAKALGTLWAGRQLPAARDALLATGLADPDPTVRRTSAASLGSAGPGRDEIVRRLRAVLATDVDARVRQAAAKSILDLDEAAAATNLMPALADDPEIWRLFRDHLVDDVHRRDKTPARVLAAADVLVANGLARLAVDLLTEVGAIRDGLWETEGGRVALLERLARLHLDQGEPEAARRVVRDLLDELPRDAGAPRRRAELVLAMALCRSGRESELREAFRSLDALRFAEELSAERRAEASVELGDCLLRLADPAGAVRVLAPIASRSDLPAALAKKAVLLHDDAKARSDAEKKDVLALVESLDGDAPEEARRSLVALGPRAARHLLAALDDTQDAQSVRRLVRAAGLVASRDLGQLPAGASASDVGQAADAAREALRALLQRAAETGNGAR